MRCMTNAFYLKAAKYMSDPLAVVWLAFLLNMGGETWGWYTICGQYSSLYLFLLSMLIKVNPFHSDLAKPWQKKVMAESWGSAIVLKQLVLEVEWSSACMLLQCHSLTSNTGWNQSILGIEFPSALSTQTALKCLEMGSGSSYMILISTKAKEDSPESLSTQEPALFTGGAEWTGAG